MLPIIQVQPGCHKRFLVGYPWLYANEIVQSPLTKTAESGQLVALECLGKKVATGYFNRHSLIAFRVLSHNPDEIIDADFFIRRLQRALDVRALFYTTPYYRLVHAEADDLPGLIIDRFDSVFVVQLNTQGMQKLQNELITALQQLYNPDTIYIKLDSPIRQHEGLPIAEPIIIGKVPTELSVLENDTQFTIDMKTSQKTGWFFDHRDNRNYIAQLAKGKTVIDYFCYSGGFSVQAAKHNALHVTGVDASAGALENAKRSAALNQVQDKCTFVCADTFKDMDARIQKSEKFDIVVLDPPAFVKSKKDLTVGLKGYEKLLTKAIALIAQNGILLIASCSYHVKDFDLKSVLARALHKNKREGRIHRTLAAGPDHPGHPMLEESSYLKGFLVTLK